MLAAELTGVSQLVGLLFAPLFGFFADKYQRFNVLLLLAAFSGVLGYLSLTTLRSPKAHGKNGSPWIYVIMGLLGISQIGAIVCSLGLLGRCVLGPRRDSRNPDNESSNSQPCDAQDTVGADVLRDEERDPESTPLLEIDPAPYDLQHLKGSIAGVYSLSGGVGILLLTKLGGVLFDKSPSAPFFMLSLFNALLLVAGVLCGALATWERRAKQNTS